MVPVPQSSPKRPVVMLITYLGMHCPADLRSQQAVPLLLTRPSATPHHNDSAGTFPIASRWTPPTPSQPFASGPSPLLTRTYPLILDGRARPGLSDGPQADPL